MNRYVLGCSRAFGFLFPSGPRRALVPSLWYVGESLRWISPCRGFLSSNLDVTKGQEEER